MKILLIGPPSSGKSVIVGAAYAATRRGSGLVLKARVLDRFRLRSLANATRPAPTRSRRVYRLRYRGPAEDETIEVIDYPGRMGRSAGRAAIQVLLQDLDEADVVIATQGDMEGDLWGPALRASLARRRLLPALLFVRMPSGTNQPRAGHDAVAGDVAAPPGMTAAAVVIGRDQASLPLLWGIANSGRTSGRLADDAHQTLARTVPRDGADVLRRIPSARPAARLPGRRKKGLPVPERLQTTIAMLGAPESGKTTFMVAMIGTLAHGTSGYFLTYGYGGDPLRGHDEFSELQDTWDALRVEGKLPRPTNDDPRSYSLVFTRGVEPVLDIDWIDYRGGVITDRSDRADVAHMIDRVAASDCIFLVLDAQYLTERVSPANRLDIERRMQTNRLSAIVQQAIQRRLGQDKPVTSLVVLITKVDLLDAADTMTGEERQRTVERLVDDVHTLLPIAFSERVTAMIAPVSVGRLGTAAQGVINPDRVSPLGLHRPLLFAVLAGHWQKVDDYADRAARAESARHQARMLPKELRSQGKYGQALLAVLKGLGTGKDADGYRELERLYATWADELTDEFRNLLIFRGGKRVE